MMKEINLWDKASDLAIKTTIKKAREILKNDPNLNEFIMGMGGCFFTIKDGGKYDILRYSDDEYEEWIESDDYVYSYTGIVDDSHGFQKEFFEMVDELNEKFKICGYPVRFTAYGDEVHDW